MSTNVYVLVTWPTSAEAFEGFVKLNELHAAGALEVFAAGVVTRNADGSFDVRDGDNKAIGLGTLGGGTLGVLMGVLGGPLGVLLGGTSGALLGGLWHAAKADDTLSALQMFSQALPPGTTGLVAEVNAFTPTITELGGNAIYESVEAVEAELAAAEDAADAAAREARRELRDQRKAERHDTRQERLAKLKAKLHRS